MAESCPELHNKILKEQISQGPSLPSFLTLQPCKMGMHCIVQQGDSYRVTEASSRLENLWIEFDPLCITLIFRLHLIYSVMYVANSTTFFNSFTSDLPALNPWKADFSLFQIDVFQPHTLYKPYILSSVYCHSYHFSLVVTETCTVNFPHFMKLVRNYGDDLITCGKHVTICSCE